MVASWDGKVSCISFGVTDHDLIPRIIVSGSYLVYYLREESKFWFMGSSLDVDMPHTIFRSL